MCQEKSQLLNKHENHFFFAAAVVVIVVVVLDGVAFKTAKSITSVLIKHTKRQPNKEETNINEKSKEKCW